MTKTTILKLCNLLIESEKLDQQGKYDEAEDLLLAICDALNIMTKTAAINPLSNPSIKEPLNFLGHAFLDFMGKVPRGKWGKAVNQDIAKTLKKLADTSDIASIKNLFPSLKEDVLKEIAESKNLAKIFNILKSNHVLEKFTDVSYRPLTKIVGTGALLSGLYGGGKAALGLDAKDTSRGHVLPQNTNPENNNVNQQPYQPYQPYQGGPAYFNPPNQK